MVFPSYKHPDGSYSIMHRKMGFYVSGTGRLLTLEFYGFVPHHENIDMPNDGKGIGRVVREVYMDGSQWGQLYIETTDGKRAVPGSLVFDSDGWIKVRYGGSCGLKKLIEYLPELWYEIELEIDAHTHQIKYYINGKKIGPNAWFVTPVMTVEKFVLRTGNMRRQLVISCDMDVYGCMKG